MGAAGWKATSLPPKPKDAPVGHFNHLGAGALGRAAYINMYIFIDHQMNHIKEGMQDTMVSTVTTAEVVQLVLCR